MTLKQTALLTTVLAWLGVGTILAGEAGKPQCIRNEGVTLRDRGDKKVELSEHARAFREHLARIITLGKVDQPKESPRHERERAVKGGKTGRGGGYSRKKACAPMAMRAMAKAPSGASVGVTAGGMQDIGQARKIIGEGKVPTPAMITPEGLISEHDIPLEGYRTGKSDLYASASLAWTRRYGKKTPEAVVQIGFGVDMNLEDFDRQPLNLAVVVDVSGSMGGGKIEAARKGLVKLVDQLNAKDRLAVTLFNNVAWTPLPSTVMSTEARAEARKLLGSIQSGGGTNIEAGLKFGFEQVAANLSEAGRSPRVMLFTDARPNVGKTRAQGFMPLTDGGAAHGIGLTAFGVGIDFGQDLAYEIFQTRGANYFFLENNEKIAKVFDDEFDFMVTPAAYDVKIQLAPATGVEVTDVLGVPDYKVGTEVVSMSIPTLFFSKRGGGGATMIAMKVKEVKSDAQTPLGDVVLFYDPVSGTKTIQQRLKVFLPAKVDTTGAKPFYSQPGAEKALLLAHACLAMKGACKGQKGLVPDDAVWFNPPPAIRKANAGKRGRIVRRGNVITLTKEQAVEASKGLGGFADWFAVQGADFPALEPELRLIESLEKTLRKHGGLAQRDGKRPFKNASSVPDTAPPIWDEEF